MVLGLGSGAGLWNWSGRCDDITGRDVDCGNIGCPDGGGPPPVAPSLSSIVALIISSRVGETQKSISPRANNNLA